jgi:hypothetical protein
MDGATANDCDESNRVVLSVGPSSAGRKSGLAATCSDGAIAGVAETLPASVLRIVVSALRR